MKNLKNKFLKIKINDNSNFIIYFVGICFIIYLYFWIKAVI